MTDGRIREYPAIFLCPIAPVADRGYVASFFSFHNIFLAPATSFRATPHTTAVSVAPSTRRLPHTLTAGIHTPP